MTELEIINPSDKLFISDEDREAACAAVLFLGSGKYGLRDQTGERVLPIFIFGGNPQEWWRDQFGHSADDFISDVENKKRVAKALDTIRYEHERTSMNDIGSYAKELSQYFATAPGGKIKQS